MKAKWGALYFGFAGRSREAAPISSERKAQGLHSGLLPSGVINGPDAVPASDAAPTGYGGHETNVAGDRPLAFDAIPMGITQV